MQQYSRAWILTSQAPLKHTTNNKHTFVVPARCSVSPHIPVHAHTHTLFVCTLLCFTPHTSARAHTHTHCLSARLPAHTFCTDATSFWQALALNRITLKKGPASSSGRPSTRTLLRSLRMVMRVVTQTAMKTLSLAKQL